MKREEKEVLKMRQAEKEARKQNEQQEQQSQDGNDAQVLQCNILATVESHKQMEASVEAQEAEVQKALTFLA